MQFRKVAQEAKGANMVSLSKPLDNNVLFWGYEQWDSKADFFSFLKEGKSATKDLIKYIEVPPPPPPPTVKGRCRSLARTHACMHACVYRYTASMHVFSSEKCLPASAEGAPHSDSRRRTSRSSSPSWSLLWRPTSLTSMPLSRFGLARCA